MQISGLFAGRTQLLQDNKTSAIRKAPIVRGVVNEQGLVDDEQADRTVHGGAEKALHQFSLAAYAKIAAQYPQLAARTKPGNIGENLCVDELHDGNVCIGDVYRMGEVLVQISAPRIPCWKIDALFATPGLHRYLAEQAICGWYYRVLSGGELATGMPVTRLERPNPEVSVTAFMQLIQGKIDDIAEQQRYVSAQGLDPQWARRLRLKLGL